MHIDFFDIFFYNVFMSKFTDSVMAKRIAVLALLTALSLITFLIESLFPPLFIPGAKMGLSNIFSLLALIIFSPKEAYIVIIARTVLSSFFSGNVSSLMYSFTAGIIAITSSSLMVYFLKRVSLVAISVFSAVLHNLVQLTVYMLVMKTSSLIYYMPYLAVLGVVAGVIVGLAATFIIKKIPMTEFEKFIYQKQKKQEVKK